MNLGSHSPPLKLISRNNCSSIYFRWSPLKPSNKFSKKVVIRWTPNRVVCRLFMNRNTILPPKEARCWKIHYFLCVWWISRSPILSPLVPQCPDVKFCTDYMKCNLKGVLSSSISDHCYSAFLYKALARFVHGARTFPRTCISLVRLNNTRRNHIHLPMVMSFLIHSISSVCTN